MCLLWSHRHRATGWCCMRELLPPLTLVPVPWKHRYPFLSRNGIFDFTWLPYELGFDVQEGVAIEIAEAVVGALKGELAATAVNAPMVPAEV